MSAAWDSSPANCVPGDQQSAPLINSFGVRDGTRLLIIGAKARDERCVPVHVANRWREARAWAAAGLLIAGSLSQRTRRAELVAGRARRGTPRDAVCDSATMALGFAGAACEYDEMVSHVHACPCCGHLTLGERGGFEICSVCFWEDDGQDDVDAHLNRGGPNRGTLWDARANFLKFQACEEAARSHVRPPAADEPRVQRWSLLDEVAVELVPSSDVAPWNLLHDGVVPDVVRDRDRATLVVDIPYLRARFAQPGSGVRVDLLDCSLLEYAPYEGAASSLASEIALAHPNLVEAIREGDNVVVWGSAGALRLRYEHLALRFDDGAPLAVAALDECARAYWEEWDRDVRQSCAR